MRRPPIRARRDRQREHVAGSSRGSLQPTERGPDVARQSATVSPSGKSHSHARHVLGSLPELSVIEASQALAAVYRYRKQIRPELREVIFGSAEA